MPLNDHARNDGKPIRRLHIGGWVRADGWEVIDANPGEAVNHVGDASDLSRFADGTFVEVYASHVLEHFDFRDDLPAVLQEWRRVLKPGGTLYVSVPDLERLCHLYLTPRLEPEVRMKIMCMMYGSHMDAYDYHLVGMDEHLLAGFLIEAGFSNLRRVQSFNLFRDTSTMEFLGVPISLNVMATR